ncbi:MAG: YhcH/YjgK/YiaL family protein [Alphaproteobacteria bacterium]|nr:YhcH/YjgK/YiaL family protein [Alphaproteobacteria bacterium]
MKGKFADLRQNEICGGYAEEMIELLKSLSKNFLLGRKDLSALAEKMYANAEVYNSRAEGPYESHERFIDVQCVLEGQEEIELCPVDKLSVTEEYDATRDIAFYDGKTPCTDKVILKAGECCIIVPGMGHKPCMDSEGKHFVKKVVFKIPVKG